MSLFRHGVVAGMLLSAVTHGPIGSALDLDHRTGVLVADDHDHREYRGFVALPGLGELTLASTSTGMLLTGPTGWSSLP